VSNLFLESSLQWQTTLFGTVCNHDRSTLLGAVAVFNSMAPDNYNNDNSKYFADTHVELLR